MTDQAFIYIIGAKESPLVKIGTTDNVARRLREIQNMSPVRLTVLWRGPGNESLERALHRRFRRWRKHGEWFHLESPVEDVQQALLDPTLLNPPVRKTPFKSARPAEPYSGPKYVFPSSWKPPRQLTGKAAEVHQDLRSRIQSGEFPAGLPIPRPRDLAEAYGVPTITASSAVKCLEAEGLVSWPRGEQATVAMTAGTT